MPYDRRKHHRRSIGLPDHDYRSSGAYFVTICVHAGECLLGEVVDGEMCLNEWGHVVSHYWMRIPNHSDHVQLDKWVVMPNHLHGILIITNPVGAQHAAPLPSTRTNVQPGSLGAIIRSFKSAATRRINHLRDTPGARVWQRNYYEHIVRNDSALERIREYIQHNPARWTDDRLHPGAEGNPFTQSQSQARSIHCMPNPNMW